MNRTTAGAGFFGSTSRRERIARLEAVADLLDIAFVIPGTGIRFGFDSLVGLVPGIGDALTSAISLWIVYEAHQLGARPHILARMIANIAVDGMIGAVPVVGDAFDIAWRANRKNVRILRQHLARRGLD
jgi:hypothetical protein